MPRKTKSMRTGAQNQTQKSGQPTRKGNARRRNRAGRANPARRAGRGVVVGSQVPWGTLPGVNTNMGPNTTQQAVIEKDEFITQFNGSSSFVATKFSLNPGLSATFPAGSLDAQLWSEWECDMVEFYVRPLVSAFSTQGQTGKTLLSFDYNAANSAPTSQQQAEIMPHADGMPFEDVLLRLDPRCINRSDAKYVRTALLQPANTDIKTYDGGNLWLCTYGQPGTATCGELRVRYRFRMTKATLLNPFVGQVGVMSSGSGTVASPLLAGVAAGAFAISQALTVVSFSQLTIGAEYVIYYAGTTFGSTVSFGTLVGVTLKNTFIDDGGTSGITVTATALSGSVTLTLGGTITNPIFVLSSIPTISL